MSQYVLDLVFNIQPTNFTLVYLAHYKIVFGGRRTYVWCIGSWVIGICIALPTFHPCCRVVLRPQFYSWVYDDTPGGSAYSIIDLVTSIAVCVERTFINVKL